MIPMPPAERVAEAGKALLDSRLPSFSPTAGTDLLVKGIAIEKWVNENPWLNKQVKEDLIMYASALQMASHYAFAHSGAVLISFEKAVKAARRYT